MTAPPIYPVGDHESSPLRESPLVLVDGGALVPVPDGPRDAPADAAMAGAAVVHQVEFTRAGRDGKQGVDLDASRAPG